MTAALFIRSYGAFFAGGILAVASGCTSAPSYSLVDSMGDDSTVPRIHCAINHVCAIEMRPGLRIRDLKVGDSTGWTISRSTSGEGESSRSVLMIEATRKAKESNILVTTNDGTLDFQLIPLKRKSH